MDAIEAIVFLEKSNIFEDWRKQNPDFYLVNAFAIIDSANPQPQWQIGYYSKKKDSIVTFLVAKEITRSPESEVFKKKSTVFALDMPKVKIGVEEALNSAVSFQSAKYPSDAPLKKIILLQNLDKEHIYNITFITKSFKTLNIKISSLDGKVVFEKLSTLFDFQDKKA